MHDKQTLAAACQPAHLISQGVRSALRHWLDTPLLERNAFPGCQPYQVLQTLWPPAPRVIMRLLGIFLHRMLGECKGAGGLPDYVRSVRVA